MSRLALFTVEGGHEQTLSDTDVCDGRIPFHDFFDDFVSDNKLAQAHEEADDLANANLDDLIDPSVAPTEPLSSVSGGMTMTSPISTIS